MRLFMHFHNNKKLKTNSSWFFSLFRAEVMHSEVCTVKCILHQMIRVGIRPSAASIGWVVSFGGFDCFLLLVVVGARNKFGSTLYTFVLTSLKPNTQFVYGLGCTLLHTVQVILNHFLAHNSSLKMRSQAGNLLL
jgi:hypothetical protein